jgi:hypothetical protein
MGDRIEAATRHISGYRSFFTTFFAFRKLLFVTFLVASLGLNNEMFAQTGGKKREGGVKRRASFSLFHRKKSQGHADEFARGNSGRRSIWSRLFRRERPAWVYKPSGNVRTNYKENRFLFFRFRSKGRDENAMNQDRSRKERTRQREHGNRVFRFKKYKRAK